MIDFSYIIMANNQIISMYLTQTMDFMNSFFHKLRHVFFQSNPHLKMFKSGLFSMYFDDNRSIPVR